VVSGENVVAKRKGNNDQHQKSGVILDRLVNDQLAVNGCEGGYVGLNKAIKFMF
jgi:hypothetical protein